MRSESDGEFSRCKAFGKKACKVAGPVRFGERAEPGNAPHILLANCRNFLDREVSHNTLVRIFLNTAFLYHSKNTFTAASESRASRGCLRRGTEPSGRCSWNANAGGHAPCSVDGR